MAVPPLYSISDLNKDWLTKVLTHSTSIPVTVSGFTLGHDLDTSDGYLSSIYAVTVVTSSENLSLVLKLLPEDEDAKGLVKIFSLAYRENSFYKFVLNQNFQNILSFNQILPVPKVYYSGCCQDAFTLLMENLISKGYKSIVAADGADMSSVKAAFKSVALIHAYGYRYIEIYGPDSLREFQTDENNLGELIDEEMKKGLNVCCDLLKGGALYDKLKNISEKEGYKYLRENTNNSRERLPSTLIHGDFWSGQTMCNYDNDVCIIDWQFVNFSNPTDDLASYLLMSCGDDVLHHLEEVLNTYASQLNEYLILQKCRQRFSTSEIAKSIHTSFGRGLCILLCSVESFVLKNKINEKRLLQALQFADSLKLFSLKELE